MAYLPHWLLSFGGARGTTGEQWSCGIRLSVTEQDLGGSVDEESYLTSVALPALTTWFANTASRVPTAVRLGFIKFNEINGLGHYADTGVTHERILATPLYGGTSSAALPYQCAVVYSWESKDRSRGPGSKGRIYSPGTAGLVMDAGTGLIPQADCLSMGNSMASLLTSLDTTLGGPGGAKLRPSICSSSGVSSQIDYVRVDSRVDTQRRRAHQLVPGNTVIPITY